MHTYVVGVGPDVHKSEHAPKINSLTTDQPEPSSARTRVAMSDAGIVEAGGGICLLDIRWMSSDLVANE